MRRGTVRKVRPLVWVNNRRFALPEGWMTATAGDVDAFDVTGYPDSDATHVLLDEGDGRAWLGGQWIRSKVVADIPGQGVEIPRVRLRVEVHFSIR